MAFYVGQDVVCVGWDFDFGGIDVPYGPEKGDTGTVCNVYVSGQGIEIVELTEWPTPDDGLLPGWDARGFRPLVKRKTDISIFTEMLKPKERELARN